MPKNRKNNRLEGLKRWKNLYGKVLGDKFLQLLCGFISLLMSTVYLLLSELCVVLSFFPTEL